ncbi:MAG: HEAT repeat domain-containing protein, partial [Candidatus Riflebacteria bacterium]|nr:HEAT repeat domain-containing protein [Candidatus Riflebacteria bacterium]
VLDQGDPDLFLAASRHVQLEPSWGAPVDTATALRARGVLALANLGYPDLLLVAGELLSDDSPPVRQAAAEALTHCGDRSGAGLLLAVFRRADEDPVVATAVLSGILSLAPDWGLPRAGALLSGPDDSARELAAIALGQSGLDEAATLLIAYLNDTPLASRRAFAVRGLGLHRSDRALEALLEIVAGGTPADAAAAVAALSPRRFDPRVRDRVRAAAERNRSANLERALQDAFPDEGPP